MNKLEIYRNQIQELNDLTSIQKDMKLSIPHIKLSSQDLVTNEKTLVFLNESIRKKWIEKVSKKTSKIYKSTLWGTVVKDIQNFNYSFSYETLLNDENKFSELMGYSIKNMYNKTFLFSSGMNAISSILYCLSSFLKDNLDIQASVGYYETKYFLKILASMGNKVRFHLKENSKSNVFFFEPIMYNASLSPTDISELISAINTSSAKIKIVIMDSSMHNITSILEKIKNKISGIENVILFDIRSGLKLDQEGLEFTNLGICTGFVSNSNISLFNMIRNYIEQYKGITGTNLSFVSLSLSHFFVNPNSKNYTKKVQKQVIWAGQELTKNRPKSIKNILWQKTKILGETLTAPFIFIELTQNDEELYLNTIRLFQSIMNKKSLPIDYRNSWGFRFPSVEYFDDIFSNKKYIKFYPGSFKGLTAIEAINSLEKLGLERR